MLRKQVFVVVLALALAACAGQTGTPGPAPAATSAPVAAQPTLAVAAPTAPSAPTVGAPAFPPAPSVNVPSTWKQYKASVRPGEGYIIAVPATWRIEHTPGTPETQVSLYSFVAGTANPGAPVSSDQTKIDIVPLPELAGKTLADIVAASTSGPGGKVLDQRQVSLNGIPAERVDLDTPQGKSVALFFLLGSQPMVIQGYGDLSTFEPIVSTLRETKG